MCVCVCACGVRVCVYVCAVCVLLHAVCSMHVHINVSMHVCMYVCMYEVMHVCMYVCVYVLNVYWLVCMSVVMKVRSNCAIHNRIDHFNENITCIHYIIIVLLGLYSDAKFR